MLTLKRRGNTLAGWPLMTKRRELSFRSLASRSSRHWRRNLRKKRWDIKSPVWSSWQSSAPSLWLNVTGQQQSTTTIQCRRFTTKKSPNPEWDRLKWEGILLFFKEFGGRQLWRENSRTLKFRNETKTALNIKRWKCPTGYAGVRVELELQTQRWHLTWISGSFSRVDGAFAQTPRECCVAGCLWRTRWRSSVTHTHVCTQSADVQSGVLRRDGRWNLWPTSHWI